jgi:hypothetical protein
MKAGLFESRSTTGPGRSSPRRKNVATKQDKRRQMYVLK